MKLKWKFTLFLTLLFIIGVIVTFLYFKYFFTSEQKNITKRKIESITGLNLKITIFDVNGKRVKVWYNVGKITSGKDERNYIYFYTKDNKYVQIPNSVWYIAEQE